MKNFTKQNFKTNPLWIRLLIMAFMLLAGASSAWAWTIIYDNSDTKWDEVYLYIGKGDWSECNLKMTEYDTNLFVFKGSGWNDATEVAFANKPLGGSSTGNICTKLKNDNTVKPKVTYCHEKDFNKTYKYKATGLTSNDANCSNESRYYWPNTNDRVETTFNGTVIQLAGSFNDWGSSTDYCVSTNNSTCSFEKELAANDKYEFKIIIDGTWYSQNAVTVDGSKVTFKNPWDANSSFKASKDGIYTFYVDKDKQVWITYRTACDKPDAPSIEINNDTSAKLCSGSATITTTEVTGATSYSLYKGSATTASQTNATGTFTVSEASTYYVTVTTCTESDKSTGVTLSYYTAPTLTDKYSVTNATKCNNTPNNDGAISIQNGVDGVTYSLNDDEGTSWSGLAKGTYTLKATLDACNNLSDTETVEVGETDKTPAINDISIKEVSAVCKGDNLTLQLEEAVQDGVTYTWYKSNTSSSSIGTGTSLVLTDLQETSTYILVASKTENGCTATKAASIEVTVNAIPTAPDATTFDPVCSGVGFELPSISGNWYAAEEGGDPIARDIAGITTQTTYYASAINEGCESVDRTALVVNVKNKPAVPTLTAENNVTEIVVGKTTATLQVGNIEQDATYTLYKDGEPTQNTGTSFVVSEGGTYKVVASNNNGCGTSGSDEITITTCTPISNVAWRITKGEKDVYCSDDEVQVTLNYNGDTATEHTWNLNGVTVSNEDDIASGTIYTMIINESGSVQLTLTGCDGAYSPISMQFTVSSETVAPTIGISKNSICEGEGAQTITVNGYNPNYTYALYKNGVKQNTTISNTGTFTVNTTGEYTVTAKNCVESTPSNSVSLTVNPLPRITAISVNNSTPVINEDVLLTVEGSDIARVEWSITSGNNASLSDASGNSVKLTSTASGAVTVTATAISINGCRATSTKEVTFKAVDECEPNVTTHTTKTKIRAKMKEGQTSWNVFKIYSYGVTDSDSNGWPGAEMDLGTGEDEGYYVYTFEDATADFNIILNNGNSGGENQTVSGAAKAGKIYTFEVGAKTCSQDNDTRRCLESSNVDFTTTSDPELSAPAVKTVSVNSEQGSGVVNFVGKVIKTGCANGSAIWVGYQYKKANEAWPTTGVTAGSGEKQLVSIDNNPGSEDFTVNVEGLENGDYHFRAYVINGYGRSADANNYDQGVYYGLDKLVTVSTVKTPISNVTLNYCDENGGSVGVDPNPMCKGATAYVKLTYTGSRNPEMKWLSDGTPTEKLTKVKELEITGLEAEVWSFEIQGNEQISVELKNEENTDWVPSEKLSFEMVPEALSPTISYDKAIICSNDPNGATLKLDALVEGQTYELWKYTNDKLTESAAVEGVDAIVCISTTEELGFAGLKESGKYFVKAYTADCTADKASSNYATLEVVNASDVYIRIVPETAETTPWMPVKLTIDASGDYNVTASPENAIINKSGDICKVKLPLPETRISTDCHGNVLFSGTDYTVTATLTTSGGDNPCAVPANATIRLTPYIEPCTTELPACN